MLVEQTLFGTIDLIKIAIELLQYFEPPEGYYLAFSGGKDSQVIYHLAKEAGVKFDAHYHLTTVDPPELIYFIRNSYPDVSIDGCEKTMWQLIEKKGLPTRKRRWCCSEFKEHGGEGRICITGVRWAESNSRKNKRNSLEVSTQKKANTKLFNDNDEGRKLFENCTLKGRRILNPIVGWKNSDPWEYLKSRNIQYCELYDEGFDRLGCIGCPMADMKRIQEFERWPKYLEAYKRAVGRFLPGYLEKCKARGLEPISTTIDGIMHWWIYGRDTTEYEGQLAFFKDYYGKEAPK
jgi:phosphoadenosine phosphosulfate reductase